MLDWLGQRICILGPSNSGKSTLARAIAQTYDLDPIYLDLFFHRPGTDWEPRPEHEFRALHEQAIAGDSWVIDGNYSRYWPQRCARATGVILLDVGTATSLWRYLRRTLFEGRTRAGALPGGRDSLKWEMIRYVAVTSQMNRKRYAAQFAALMIPKVALRSPGQIAAFYKAEGLSRYSQLRLAQCR